jgi:hypothetical protein
MNAVKIFSDLFENHHTFSPTNVQSHPGTYFLYTLSISKVDEKYMKRECSRHMYIPPTVAGSQLKYLSGLFY